MMLIHVFMCIFTHVHVVLIVWIIHFFINNKCVVVTGTPDSDYLHISSKMKIYGTFIKPQNWQLLIACLHLCTVHSDSLLFIHTQLVSPWLRVLLLCLPLCDHQGCSLTEGQTPTSWTEGLLSIWDWTWKRYLNWWNRSPLIDICAIIPNPRFPCNSPCQVPTMKLLIFMWLTRPKVSSSSVILGCVRIAHMLAWP